MNIDMNFKGNDPGAVQYGNFINYYKFNLPENRIKVMPDNIWENNSGSFVALDCGCNSGDLTQSLYEFLEQKLKFSNHKPNIHLLGIDIDPTLVQRAKETNKFPNNVTYQCFDIMKADERSVKIKQYWDDLNLQIFDAVFCFSITMWIHLNNGDEGLELFLKNIMDIANMIVIEPQPWKCYRTAIRRMKRCESSFPLFKDLKVRQNVEIFINDTLVQNHFTKVAETSSTEWGRKISVYKRNPQHKPGYISQNEVS